MPAKESWRTVTTGSDRTGSMQRGLWAAAALHGLGRVALEGRLLARRREGARREREPEGGEPGERKTEGDRWVRRSWLERARGSCGGEDMSERQGLVAIEEEQTRARERAPPIGGFWRCWFDHVVCVCAIGVRVRGVLGQGVPARPFGPDRFRSRNFKTFFYTSCYFTFI
jgi:hypothetical protein